MLKKYALICLLAMLPISSVLAQGFTEVSISSGIQHLHRSNIEMGGGAAWFDMDRDGDEDLIMTGGLNGVGLYRNEGNGQFTDITQAAGLGFLDNVQTMGVCTGDIDNDGYREIFFTTFMQLPSVLLYNNGNGTFTDISVSSGIAADTTFTSSAMFFDVDHDRDLDLFVGNYILYPSVIQDTNGNVIGYNPVCLPDQLYINDGSNHFVDMATAVGIADSGCALAVTATHDLLYQNRYSIFVANDFGEWNIPNQWYVQMAPNGSVFDNISQPSGMDVGMYGMGIAQGDYDHDNDIDFYITNIGPNKLMNYTSTYLQFKDTAQFAGVRSGTLMGLNTTGWGTAFIDYDNDSWEDLFTCNGQITVTPIIANILRDPDKLYHNNQNGTFTDVTMAMGIEDSGWGRGMIRGDYDLDGDDDILTMVTEKDTASTEHTKLWRNDHVNSNHWVNLRLEGTTFSPRDPYGAAIYIQVGTERWIHEISGGGSHMSQNSSIVHIGLGSATTFEANIVWPNGGVQPLIGMPIDTTITILEDSSQFVSRDPYLFAGKSSMKVYPNPSQGNWGIELQHALTEDVWIEVYDMQGRMVLQRFEPQATAGNYRLQFDAMSLPRAGSYLVRLRTEHSLLSSLFIRQ